MRAKTVRKVRVKQRELDFRSWGGARRGAGRKPKGARALVPHDTRPVHKARFPMLITSRLRPGLPSLRHEREAAIIRAALASANLAAGALAAEGAQARANLPPNVPPNVPPKVQPKVQTQVKAPGRSMPPNGRKRQPREVVPFQVVHHSIQSNHLHLIVEAEDRTALTAGMRSLLIRIARALNRLWNRAGSVFSDRFHEHELHKPREVRNALVYVLHNLRKHGIWIDGPDPLSSGSEFDGWRPKGVAGGGSGLRSNSAHVALPTHRGWTAACAPVALHRAARAETPNPKTWLLDVGWRRHGLIDPDERPRAR